MSNREKYPIVLAHGIARFDFLLNFFSKTLDALGLNVDSPNDALHYFKGIAGHLRSHGFDVYHSSVSFAGRVDRRAEDLRNEVNKVLTLRGRKKVHIIAHSMGGLDARHMIVNPLRRSKNWYSRRCKNPGTLLTTAKGITTAWYH